LIVGAVQALTILAALVVPDKTVGSFGVLIDSLCFIAGTRIQEAWMGKGTDESSWAFIGRSLALTWLVYTFVLAYFLEIPVLLKRIRSAAYPEEQPVQSPKADRWRVARYVVQLAMMNALVAVLWKITAADSVGRSSGWGLFGDMLFVDVVYVGGVYFWHSRRSR
jgi:hypothetical protein